MRLRHGTIVVAGVGEWLRLAAHLHARLYPALAVERLGRHDPVAARRRERAWARRVVRALRVRLVVTGREHVDPEERYVVAPLHESVLDPLLLLHLPLPLRFALRTEILEWPDVGPHLRRAGHIPVDPESGRAGYRRLLRAAAEPGRDSLVVFPQGAVLGIEAAFSAGPFRLAQRTGLPLLPVVLTGSHRVWEHPFSPRLRTGCEVGMMVLPAIDTATGPPEQIRVDLERRMKSIALSGLLPAPRRYVPERDGFWDGYHFDIDPTFPDVAAAVAAHRAEG